MLRAKTTSSLDLTIVAIATHSKGVTWRTDSEGFGLTLTAGGYALTSSPEHQGTTLHERVLITREDGSPMSDGHILTQREREGAVRAILQGTLKRRMAPH